MAACCDLVVASDQATFGQPEIKVGVFPILGVALYPAMLGAKAANEILLTGAVYSAEEAQRLGLVNRVYADESFDADVGALPDRPGEEQRCGLDAAPRRPSLPDSAAAPTKRSRPRVRST